MVRIQNWFWEFRFRKLSLVAAAVVAVTWGGMASAADWWSRPNYCPPPIVAPPYSPPPHMRPIDPSTPGRDADAPTDLPPGEGEQRSQDQQVQPQPDPLSPQDLSPQQTAAPMSAPMTAPVQTASVGGGGVPNMIGDTQAGACGVAEYLGTVTAIINHPTFGCSHNKIAENNSPIPRDRVYFTYQHFHNAIDLALIGTSPQSLNIDKYTFGWEQTFDCGLSSVELRIPFATQLTNDIVADSNVPSLSSHEETYFGNTSVAYKRILRSSCSSIVSGGVITTFPTAPDVDIRDVEDDEFGGMPQLIDNSYEFRNDSVIVSPFLGYLYNPCHNPDVFMQAFTQVEFDTTGSSLKFTPRINGVLDAGRVQTIELESQTLLRVDVGGGYWFYRNPCGSLTGAAMLVEIHWTSTLDDAETGVIPGRDPDELSPVTIGNTANRQDIVNLTVGPTFQFGDNATIAIGSVLPLSQDEDKAFDYELNLQVNYFFGAQRSPRSYRPGSHCCCCNLFGGGSSY